MPNNIAASMTASIVIDKSDLLAQILKGLSEGQKELENNKLEMYFDFSDSKNKAEFEKTLQKYKKQLASNDFVVKITNEGIEETVKSLDKLLDVVKYIASGKGFGTGSGNGNGIGNSIVDENQLKTVIDLFTKMESSLASIKKIFVDVGDGEEFSPLFSMINKINSSISELSSSVKDIGLNMNIDVGSDTELEAKIQSKMSNALQAYQRLFEHIKMSGVGGSMVNTNFFEFDINQFDTMMAKIQAYRKFIENMRNQVKSEFGGKDLLYTETDKKYWTSAASAMGQLTKAQNEMNKSADANPLDDLFGKTDLTGVIEQLNLIVSKLDEISVAATKFSETFSQGLNVTTSVEEVSKLTEKVKELEAELAKVKYVSTGSSETNISRGKGQQSNSSSNESNSSANEAIKRIDTLNNSIITLNNLPILPELSTQFSKLKKDVNELNFKLQNDKISIDEYGKSFKSLISDYMKLNDIQQRRDVETYNENAKRALQEEKEQAKALEIEWKNNADAIEKYENAVIELNNLKASDKGTGKKSNEIQEQQKVVDRLKQNADEAKDKLVELFNIDVNNPDVSKWNEFVELLKKAGLETDEVAQSFAKLNDSIKNAKDSIVNSVQSDIEKYNTKWKNLSATPADFNQSEKYKANLAELKEQISQFEAFRNKIASQDTISEEDIQSIAKYKSNIEEATRAIASMTAAEKGSTSLSRDKLYNKIGDYMKKNSGLSKQFRVELQKLQKQLTMRGANANVSDLTDEFLKLQIRIREAGEEGKKFWDVVKEKAWYGAASQIGMAFGVNDIIRYGQQAVSVITELDTALVDLKKTTSMSSSELENFYYDSNDIAKQMGVTTEEIINQASAWSRLGYSTKEASEQMAQLSSQFASISPGMDTDTAQEGLVSIMKAWNIDYDKVKSEIMDPINALGNSMAESNQDIVEGMERSAAALAAVGTSTKDAYAMFSSIQEVLQNAEVSGRALRSISMRIRGYDESTEELSSDLDNITGDLIDLTKTAEHSQGVSIFKEGSTTEFKSLVDYFGEIYDIWDEMTQKQQNDFLQKAFGKTQAQAGAALIQNYSAVTKSLEVMDEAAGSSDKEMETVRQSIDYKINTLKETWVGTVQDILDRGDIGTIVDGLTKISEAIGFVTSNLGILKTAALGVAGYLSFKNVGRDIMYSLFEYADNIHNLLWIQRFKVCYS